ncbi:LOW QUALITY PROTEIN: synaptopodin-2 [Perognathus longimembris pacificus]|uniref:LOW QUALITY PROTEIN: synaptopodin-2 n=1 Tax=Perognathus longimembris pacificus TaxID=214514 RepID=UPI002019CEB9|nr:LOW QUALITY PROTEIN: synaptopodin-2 [Perognathus longimembris pacificus]
MGTGDFICISMTGGAPWGFRLQGGKEQQQPLQVAKIRSQSKASGSGLCEGDEVVSINGTPCAELTYPEVIKLMESIVDSLQMLVKRPSSGISEALISETQNKPQEHLPHLEYVESTTLQIRPATKTQGGEPFTTSAQGGDPLAEDQKSASNCIRDIEETDLSYQRDPQILHSQEAIFREKVGTGPVVELQLSLSEASHRGSHSPAGAVQGAEHVKSPDPHSSFYHEEAFHINSVTAHEKADPSLRSSKFIQISSGRELTVIQGEEAEDDPGLARVEGIFHCSDRHKAEGHRLQAGKGCVVSPVEGGQSEAPPSLVSFAVSSEGTEQGEDPCSDKDHRRPHKHRARHARLRRSESLSEKQVKEAKSKCKSIALLLTDAPNPNSKGVLMFKKRRRRARKYTLVSYGTGELEREDEDEEEEGPEDAFEAAFVGASESEVDEELLSEADDGPQVVTFDWDSGLVDIERKPRQGDKMELLPDSTGKGAVMFAKRRERMDQITAQKEEERVAPGREADAVQVDSLRSAMSYRRQEEESVSVQSSVSTSYVPLGRGAAHLPQQNGLGAAPGAPEAPRPVPMMNRTAKPFPGTGAPPAALGDPARHPTSPRADLPAPPPYSAVTPPPETFARAPPQPPPWPQPGPWAQPAFYDSSERIASRDERIAVPAKRTGILQEAKRRSTTKPMFTFKEPKVSPNPELLSLLQNSEGKRGAGAGGDSGPEEDYLSLGAEACNFMQSSSAKQKTPPPVAPKPAVKSPASQPAPPVSPVWSPGPVARTQPPAFPTSNPAPGPAVSAIKIAQPFAPVRPASALNLAGPFKGPQDAVANQSYGPKPAAATPTAGPTNELPGMSGKGAQLFAKRQSRMEKYVVDSDTVQAHAARAQSPTPSLPASWKYSSNVRAPPPVAYNPIHSPSYPLAAVKSQSPAPQASKVSKKKGKKPLNTLDVMKHQPYQLSASLFTFQPPDAKESLPQRPPAKVSAAPATRQALPPRPVSVGSPVRAQASSGSVYSVPAYAAPYTEPPASFPEAASPASASPVPPGLPASPKHEVASSSYFVAPRPKFSAKRSGVTVQESGGRSLSLPGRSIPPTISPSPWEYQPAYSYPAKPINRLEKANKRPTPWEAAARSPLGLVDEAFRPRSIQESIMANVVSAARRKVLPGPVEDWSERMSYVSQTQTTTSSLERLDDNVAFPINNSMSTNYQYSSQPPYAFYRQGSRNDSEIMSLETRSDYCLPLATCNYNPHPRGWRRQT